MRTLFVDDEKEPDWYGLDADTLDIAKTYKEAEELIKSNAYDIMYLDHDLGTVKNDGSMLLRLYMTFHTNEPPKQVFCVSWNPVGVERIKYACRDYNIPFESIGNKVFDHFKIIDGQSE